MVDESRTRSSPRTLVALACFVIVVAGMKAAAPILIPFLMAIFISVLCAPALTALQRRGVPRGVALLLVILAVALAGVLFTGFAASEVARFESLIPALQGRLAAVQTSLVEDLVNVLPEFVADKIPNSLGEVIDPGAALNVVRGMLSGVTGMFANAFLILLTSVFILLEGSSFRAKLAAASENPKRALSEATEILDNVNRYMGIKTMMSLLTGGLIALWLLVLGLDFVVLFGLFAFLLNYVPNLGSILAALPAVLWALVPLTEGASVNFGLAGLVGLGYLVVNLVVGNVLEPRFMGRGLGLSTLVVFLSLVFWGWVLGPVGMLLSVPLTASLKIVLESKPETRWIGILLGPESAVTAAVPHPVAAALQPSSPPDGEADDEN